MTPVAFSVTPCIYRVVCFVQTKMSLQLYQVDQKSYLLDFKTLNTLDHPDAAKVSITCLSHHSGCIKHDHMFSHQWAESNDVFCTVQVKRMTCMSSSSYRQSEEGKFPITASTNMHPYTTCSHTLFDLTFTRAL